MSENRHIREMTASDWPKVAQIYLEGIQTGMATFETELPDWEYWDTHHRRDSRLVVEQEGEIVGWAALSPVSHRYVYRGVAEISIYISKAVWGKGIGIFLFRELIKSSEAAGIWTLQAVVFAENIRSIRLHERVGFRQVGRREKIGQLRGKWKDNILLERRSSQL